MEIKRSATIRVIEFDDGEFSWFFDIDYEPHLDMSEPVDDAVMQCIALLNGIFADALYAERC